MATSRLDISKTKISILTHMAYTVANAVLLYQKREMSKKWFLNLAHFATSNARYFWPESSLILKANFVTTSMQWLTKPVTFGITYLSEKLIVENTLNFLWYYTPEKFKSNTLVRETFALVQEASIFGINLATDKWCSAYDIKFENMVLSLKDKAIGIIKTKLINPIPNESVREIKVIKLNSQITPPAQGVAGNGTLPITALDIQSPSMSDSISSPKIMTEAQLKISEALEQNKSNFDIYNEARETQISHLKKNLEAQKKIEKDTLHNAKKFQERVKAAINEAINQGKRIYLNQIDGHKHHRAQDLNYTHNKDTAVAFYLNPDNVEIDSHGRARIYADWSSRKENHPSVMLITDGSDYLLNKRAYNQVVFLTTEIRNISIQIRDAITTRIQANLERIRKIEEHLGAIQQNNLEQTPVLMTNPLTSPSEISVQDTGARAQNSGTHNMDVTQLSSNSNTSNVARPGFRLFNHYLIRNSITHTKLEKPEMVQVSKIPTKSATKGQTSLPCRPTILPEPLLRTTRKAGQIQIPELVAKTATQEQISQPKMAILSLEPLLRATRKAGQIQIPELVAKTATQEQISQPKMAILSPESLQSTVITCDSLFLRRKQKLQTQLNYYLDPIKKTLHFPRNMVLRNEKSFVEIQQKIWREIKRIEKMQVSLMDGLQNIITLASKLGLKNSILTTTNKILDEISNRNTKKFNLRK